ncbi:PseudoU-synth-2 domain-containing protein [Mycena indigotica]|uniref:PseudoU-synth-2 domain-containing protein n=1 Tax=Mycena indigotica TaxID=2126181 RepID=A0A8H6RXN8_9AGAR|nr:PseudoU-synth-2 domain-containing protein [Mycena indigotica]KAF7289219.1 PseudoU-synth-2 domain-containing protein [Mycena indigotica]
MQLSLVIVLGSLLLWTCFAVFKRLTQISIATVRGPKTTSWLLGNMPDLFSGQVGEIESTWTEMYGGIVRFRGSFGEDRLLVTDPKALHHIYHVAGYGFLKQVERSEISRLISGRGLLWADGDDHKRHRKVLAPGFTVSQAKSFLPLFFSYAAQITAKWKEIIDNTTSADHSAVFNLVEWASRATLDVIGEAAFDYSFGAMDNVDNPVGTAYRNVLMKTFGTPSNSSLLSHGLIQYIPRLIREFVVDNIPSAGLEHVRHTTKVTTEVARDLVAAKSAALLEGKGSRDIMSLLVKANASNDVKTRLTEDELLSQMRTIILAAHETTANTIALGLLELAKHPATQTRLRNEIRRMEATIAARGGYTFTTGDLDAMPYLNAVLKEILRLHPASFNNFRRSATDDVLPLSRPITLTSGEVVNELPIPKGMNIVVSIAVYNRNKDVFGPDANVFNPERWLDGSMRKPEIPLGTYSNLLTFAGGVRNCIGWKFAILELQAFLIELVGTFEFALTPEALRLRREKCILMAPSVEGQRDKGVQLPLRVSIASRNEEFE